MDNVAFCFIVKDGDKYLEKNLTKIIQFGDLYLDNYRIYYVENDSIDKTNHILENFKKKYKNIYGKHLKLDGKHSTELCKNNNEYNCSNRTRRLAFIRNQVLNQTKKWKDCKYMIMLDLDFIDFDMKELHNMFNIIKNSKNINGIFGMSITNKKCLYDVDSVKPSYKLIEIYFNKILIKVDSAFSGFGIYKMKYIIDNNLNYNEKTNNIEHIDFNKQIKNLYVYSNFIPKYYSDGLCLGNIIINIIISALFILLIIFSQSFSKVISIFISISYVFMCKNKYYKYKKYNYKI
jgi:hypothetical protein